MKRFYSSILIVFLGVQFINSQSWLEQTSGVSGTILYSVSAVDDHNSWVCGASGTVLRTINGGTNWTSVGSAPIPNTLALYNVFGTDSLSALVTGSSATATYVYRTSNGGANWSQVFTQSGGFIDAIWMGNASAGFMYGDPVGGRWSLWGTINGGLTWDSAQFRLPQVGTETGYNNAFFFDPVSQTVWFGTNNTRIYRSTNLIIWSSLPTTGQVNSSALWFSSPTNGMTGGTGLLFTTNSGFAWNPTPTSLPGTGNITGITGITSDWWVVRQAPQIYFTFNDGSSWTTQYTAPAGNYTHLTQSRGGIPTLYAVRDNGGISKATGLLLGISPSSNSVPRYFSLNQNYPNPFNPSTKITYDLPNSGFVKLSVFDVLGREVDVLVNEKENQGTHYIDWYATNFPSGTYFYKLSANGYLQTRKMELVK